MDAARFCVSMSKKLRVGRPVEPEEPTERKLVRKGLSKLEDDTGNSLPLRTIGSRPLNSSNRMYTPESRSSPSVLSRPCELTMLRMSPRSQSASSSNGRYGLRGFPKTFRSITPRKDSSRVERRCLMAENASS